MKPLKRWFPLLALPVILCLPLSYFLLRGNRPLMTAINENITAPLRCALGKLTAHVPFSVMELLITLAVLAAAAYIVWSVLEIRKSRTKLHRAAMAVLAAVDIIILVYSGFLLMWGINYWIDGFQEKSGLYAEPVAEADLRSVTAYFAERVAETADAVQRDENGCFAVERATILSESANIYRGIEKRWPFLTFEDTGVKPMFYSRIMSRMDFTGFYCSFTGESNLNVDSPACMLPSTVAHELGHQRGIASEQECNFLGVLASVESGYADYVYSGWLMGWIYLGNALYSIDQEAYWTLWDGLPESARVDLYLNSLYWKQFERSTIKKVSTATYDGMLKAYGDERGIQSYGTVVDLLVAYYKNIAG